MKKSILFTAPILILLLNVYCGNREEKPAPVAANVIADTISKPSGDNSQNSLDWSGTYKGTIPCADCDGIRTEITLSKDLTYSLRTNYLGKSGNTIEEKGTFSWNKEGNTITLTSANEKPNQYFVGENSITQLDRIGKKITGGLAPMYVLKKQIKSVISDSNKPNAELTETYWKLVELMGHPVKPAENGKKEVHIILKRGDGRMQGFAGCNSILGVYDVKDGNFISFKNVAYTLMACPDMKLEDEFKKVLAKVDNYTISGDKLSLNKARMAPLARFEAVFPK